MYYRDSGAWVQPDQEANEFAELLDIYKELAPRRVLEIGIREGGTFYQWMKHAPPGAVIIGVDFPIGKWGENIIAEYPRFWHYAGERSVVINVILGDSHHPITQTAVAGMLGSADFIFIDGDHTYEGICNDFEYYRRLVSPGGIIAIHDILPNWLDKSIEVPRYWEELKERFTCRELVSSDNQNGYGIGLVYL